MKLSQLLADYAMEGLGPGGDEEPEALPVALATLQQAPGKPSIHKETPRDTQKGASQPAKAKTKHSQRLLAAVPAERSLASAPRVQDGTGTPSLATLQFVTEYGDHFETSKQALEHVAPVLRWLCVKLGRKTPDLVIYDPYYCQGSVVRHWHALGFHKVINHNKDFYADVASGAVPEYDVLVTNPPFSSDHKERILKYCRASHKPWLLLMPNYVANKSYWKQEDLQHHSQDSKQEGTHKRKRLEQAGVMSDRGAAGPAGPQAFYVVPSSKYEFKHPEGTGKESSPFFSIWYCHLGQHHSAQACTELQRKQQQVLGDKAKLVTSVQQLHSVGAAPAWKRPNPKQRKKLNQQQQKAGGKD